MKVRKKLLKMIRAMTAVGLMVCAGVYWLIFTANGAKHAVLFAVNQYVEADTIIPGRFDGSLASGLTIDSFIIGDIKRLKPETHPWAKKYKHILLGWAEALDIRINQARIILSPKNILTVNLTYGNADLETRITSKSIEYPGLFALLGQSHIPVHGRAERVDITCRGSLNSLAGKAHFSVRDLISDHVAVDHCRFTVNFHMKDIQGDPSIQVSYASVSIPDAMKASFFGYYRQEGWFLNLFCQELNFTDIGKIFPGAAQLKYISGNLQHVTIKVRGKNGTLAVEGESTIQNFVKQDIRLRDGHVRYSFEQNPDGLWTGAIEADQGVIYGQKTAHINLLPSRADFTGDFKNPNLKIFAETKVENTEISIKVTGPLSDPQINLSSYPPKDKDLLLLMVATGKEWKGTEAALRKGEFSFDLAKDFLDYFVFGGSQNKILEALGISEVTVKYDEDVQGVGIRKKVTGKLDATYKVEQSRNKKEEEKAVQRVGGEYRITERISLEAEKSVKNLQEKPEDRMLLKYNRRF